MYYSYLNTPIGELLLLVNQEGLEGVYFPTAKKQPDLTGYQENDQKLAEAAQQLKEYFVGKRKTFSLRLSFEGTSFQKAVWQALQKIPYGETRSYAEMAEAIGQPKATRAVGAANNVNKLPIIIPCHRVIGANGSLTGFAGGLETKLFLLNLEK